VEEVIAELRPEGPGCNSHARKGVVALALIGLRPEGPALYTM
jgi:hypothetical protein